MGLSLEKLYISTEYTKILLIYNLRDHISTQKRINTTSMNNIIHYYESHQNRLMINSEHLKNIFQHIL